MIKERSGTRLLILSYLLDIQRAFGRLAETQRRIWNLKMLEERLFKEKRSGDCFTIRQVLDLLSSNWRTVKDEVEIELKKVIF